MCNKTSSLMKLALFTLLCIAPEVLFAVDIQGSTPVDKGPVGVANVLQIMTYLILVVVIIIGSAWLFRRYGRVNSAANGDLKVIAGLSVGQRERIVLVAAGDVHLLLGVAPGRVQTLHVLDGIPATEDGNIKGNDIEKESFIARFNNEIRKKMLS